MKLYNAQRFAKASRFFCNKQKREDYPLYNFLLFKQTKKKSFVKWIMNFLKHLDIYAINYLNDKLIKYMEIGCVQVLDFMIYCAEQLKNGRR